MLDVRKPATALSRFYFDPNPQTGESMGFYYWGAVARRDYYQTLAALTTGKTGDLVAVLPERAKFQIDPRDEGRFAGWYRADWDDHNWKSLLTTVPFLGQGPYQDEQGFRTWARSGTGWRSRCPRERKAKRCRCTRPRPRRKPGCG